MEDSPLSTIASITGILTFFAAIVAFLYVRYQTLVRSEEEIKAIKRSTLTNIEDMSRMVYLEYSSTEPREMELIAAFKKELFLNELDILLRVCKATAYGEQGISESLKTMVVLVETIKSNARAEIASSSLVRDEAYCETAKRILKFGWDLRVQLILSRYRALGEFLLEFRAPNPTLYMHLMKLRSSFLRLFVGTQMVWRWYKVRDEVLKLIEKRDGFRSRLVIFALQELSTRVHVLSTTLEGSSSHQLYKVPASHKHNPKAPETVTPNRVIKGVMF
ncbi:hypothetical protein F4803DRAFT_496334 [Xylaria telfairii]|nr:hypothetical protein F4803DRAFT_496334 [Xylaria telfairii]